MLNKEELVKRFLGKFQNAFGDKRLNLVNKRLKSMKIKESNSIEDPIALATPGGTVFIQEGEDTEYKRYVINHEFLHMSSRKYKSEDYDAKHSTFGFIKDIPEEYLRKIWNESGEIINDEEFHKKYEEFKKGEVCAYFVDFEEAVTEYLNSKMNYTSEKRGRSFDNPTGYIVMHGFASGYDFNSNLIQMLTSIVPEEDILDLYLGEIKFKDFARKFDNNYSTVLSDEGKTYPFYELLKIIAHGNEKGIEEKYVEASRIMFKVYSEKLKRNPAKSEEDVYRIYDEIKNLQSTMALDTKIENMAGRSDVLEMSKIQEEFRKTLERFPNIDGRNRMRDEIDYKRVIPFTEHEMDVINTIVKSVGYKSSKVKRVVGKFIIEDDETGNNRNNLYRMLYSYSKIGDNNGVHNMIIKNKNILTLVEGIEELPEKIETVEDAIKYRQIQDFIELMSIEEILKMEDINLSIGRLTKINNHIKTMQSNSIFDGEFGKTNNMKRFEELYMTKVKMLESIAENEMKKYAENKIVRGNIKKKLKKIRDLELSEEKLLA